ncbi:MAG: hypothetical protein R6V07_13400, partial [Armatimonadota bacterium]
VYAGGGLVGLQGPSALDDGWALADTFGVDGTGAVSEAEIAADYSGDAPVPDEALAAAREAGGPSLVRVAEVPGIEMPPSIAGMGEAVGAVPVRDNVTVACVLVDEGETSPGVTLREFGEGRAVWITGRSPEYAFSRLVRSAIFWAAQKETEAARLDVTGGDGLFTWAFPGAGMIAILSTADETAEATVHCDPAILGVSGGSRVSDVVTGETVGTAADLAEGVTLTAIPNCVRLLRVEQ